MKQSLLYTLCCLALLFTPQRESVAQETASRTISGSVSDADTGEPLPGANVVVKGTTTGTTTDGTGRYSIPVPGESTVLVFSFVGYTTQEVTVGRRSTIDVELTPSATQLSDVVVTALSIEREESALGYAVQQVDGADLVEAPEPNLVNTLAGKVAGVVVVGNPSGVGGSSRITIRGERSLNMNKNQPLFVIDGVPIDNEVYGSSGRNNLEVDYGNGAGMVNPNDVESISVLKGANAAALYGSRAANGVVIITTKTGRGAGGLGVSFNTTVTGETPLVLPEWQNVYGQGNDGQFDFVDGANGGINDGVDESWGPPLDQGLLIRQFDSNGQPAPWVSRPDNVRDFFETGRTASTNLALAGSNQNGNFRISYSNLSQTGIVPNTDLGRNTFNFNGGYNFSDKFSANATINYVKTHSNNRPSVSYGTESVMYLFTWYGRQINTESLKNYWQPGREGIQQFNYNYNYHDNPYFTLYENTNGQDMDRVYGNVTLKYAFTDWLNLQVRTGTDFFNDLRERRRAFSTQRFPFGQYREEKLYFEERNSDFLLTLDRPLSSKLGLLVAAGGNHMNRTFNTTDTNAPQLSIPGIYNFGNSRVPLQVTQYNSEKQVNSLFGSAQFSYDDYLYLELTGRNDWSSTLPLDNNSYFYPSASLSAVVSNMVTLPSFITFAKLRTSLAQVGNDTDPYQLTQPYLYGLPWDNTQSVTESDRLANPELKPERVTSFEIGTDMSLLDDRLGFDVTYYDITSRDQILPIALSATSGYSTKVINAGKIRNWGVELMLYGTPVNVYRGLKWDVNVNFSSNRSKVVELAPGIDSYVMASSYATVEARIGERMGNLYGRKFLRDPNGNIIYNDEGFPLMTTETLLIGNYNPDWLAGVTNTLTFRGISLSALVDVRQGGVVYSRTKVIASTSGNLIETLEGRETGIIGEGVIQNEDGTFRPNDVRVPARDWNYSYYNRSNIEAATFDASYIKLREVRIGYRIPLSLLRHTPVRTASVALVGRDLHLWDDVPHIDPETSSMRGGTLVPGIEDMQMPTTRSLGFHLSLTM